MRKLIVPQLLKVERPKKNRAAPGQEDNYRHSSDGYDAHATEEHFLLDRFELRDSFPEHTHLQILGLSYPVSYKTKIQSQIYWNLDR